MLLHRILGGQHHEAAIERVICAVDGDNPFLHRLQQRRLRLRRRAVDLVGEQHLREDRAFGEREAVVREVEQVGAKHIARHQIRRELNTSEVQPQTRGETAGHQGLRRARHAFDEHVAFGQQAD